MKKPGGERPVVDRSVDGYSVQDRYGQAEAFMEKVRKEVEPALPDFMKVSISEFMAMSDEEREEIDRKRQEWELQQRELSKWTDVDRLRYYREHGLERCDDYPGGDAQFEADVLSGEFHAKSITDQPMMREDQYIHDKIRDGVLHITTELEDHLWHPVLKLAFRDMCGHNGIGLLPLYPEARLKYHGNMKLYRKEVLSGEYARKVLSGFDFSKQWCTGFYPPGIFVQLPE